MKRDWPPTLTVLDTVDSTNSFIKREVESTAGSLELPWLVVAHEQTAGRGRNSKSWLSDQNSLTFSIAWTPDDNTPISTELLATLPLITGLAVAEATRFFVTGDVKVKWPNDVFINGAKVAGILIESVRPAAINETIFVIGIGINCDVDLMAKDEAVAKRATSIRHHLKHNLAYSNQDLTASVLTKVLDCLQVALRDLSVSNMNLNANWERNCFLLGRWIEVRAANATIEGECLGIDERGALIIRDPNGHWQTTLSGEVIRY